MKKQRKCVHNPLKLRRSKGLIRMSKTKMFRKRAMAQMLRIGRQMGLSGKTLEDLRALPLVLEHMAGPEWAGMSKAAKLIVDKWGFEVGTTMLKTMEMLTTCLRVELGCAEPAYLREQSRALMKAMRRGGEVPPVKGCFLSRPLPSNLTINGDLTITPNKRKKVRS